VESLLDVSRIESGRFTLNLERANLADCIARLVEELTPTASKACCALKFEASGDCLGSWDRVRLEQVASNLIANAIKYAAGAPIDVSLTREGEQVVLRVGDRGPGVPSDALPKLFARFERAAPTRHFGGLGLGLYIAREIASAHGGALAAENRAGGGACFTVRLPVRSAAPSPP
jgi:signal transduction histidine kinase